MSDSQEKKSTYTFSVVFHGVSKEDADNIRDKIFEGYKPDVVKGWERNIHLINFLHHFAAYVAKKSTAVDYDAPDAFSTSAKSVLQDIEARANYTLDVTDKIVKGVGEFSKGKNEDELDSLIETLLNMWKKDSE